MTKRKMPLAMWICVGLIVGVAAGLVLMAVPNGKDIANGYIKPWGTIFLNIYKFNCRTAVNRSTRCSCICISGNNDLISRTYTKYTQIEFLCCCCRIKADNSI